MAIGDEFNQKALIEELSQLLNHRDTEIVKTISNITFDAEIQDFIDLYETVGTRNSYVWKWACHDMELVELSCVDQQWKKEVRKIKLFIVIFCTLIDDIADESKDIDLLRYMLNIVTNKTDINPISENSNYINLFIKIWKKIKIKSQELTNYNELFLIWEFDIKQLLNSHEYSFLVNKSSFFDNEIEQNMYSPHQMTLMIFSTLDVMVSPDFDLSELGKLREIMWHSSLMYSIVHNLATWQREVPKGDFSSKVIARGLKQNVISLEDLRQSNFQTIIDKIKHSSIEQSFVEEWVEGYSLLSQKSISSINLQLLLKGLKKGFKSTISSFGMM